MRLPHVLVECVQVEVQSLRLAMMAMLMATNDTEGAAYAAEGARNLRALQSNFYDLYAGRNGLPSILEMDQRTVWQPGECN